MPHWSQPVVVVTDQPQGKDLLIIALLPLLAAIPLTGLVSVWDAIAIICLVHRAAASLRDRSLRAWILLAAAAIVGVVVAATLTSHSVPSVGGLTISIVSFAGTLSFTMHLHRINPRSLWLATAALALGSTASAVIRQAPGLEENPWKFGMGFGITLAALSLLQLSNRRRPSAELPCLAILALISLITGTRALAGILLATMVLATPDHILSKHKPMTRLLVKVAITTIVALLTLPLADHLASSSLASSSADRFLRQTEVNANPLLAGRIEPPISIAAIMAAPIFGLGPNAQPTTPIVANALDIARVMGYRSPYSLIPWWTQNGQIYTHSMLFGTWIAGGILAGALLIAALLVIAIRLAKFLISVDPAPSAVFFLAATSFWNILFSPVIYGSFSMLGLSVAISIVVSSSSASIQSRSLHDGQVDKSPNAST